MTNEIKWEKAEDSENGLITQTMLWPEGYWPVTVYSGNEYRVFRRSWKTTMSVPVKIIKVWTFLGLDQGDIVEADIEVYSKKGTPIVLRSKHKEIPTSYDAWKPYKLDIDLHTQLLRVVVTCRAGRNSILDNRLYARVHYGLIIIGHEIYDGV